MPKKPTSAPNPAFPLPKRTKMTHRRALHLAVQALLDKQKPFNVDANLFARGLAGNLPGFEHAWRRREALREAAELLKGELNA